MNNDILKALLQKYLVKATEALGASDDLAYNAAQLQGVTTEYASHIEEMLTRPYKTDPPTQKESL